MKMRTGLLLVAAAALLVLACAETHHEQKDDAAVKAADSHHSPLAAAAGKTKAKAMRSAKSRLEMSAAERKAEREARKAARKSEKMKKQDALDAKRRSAEEIPAAEIVAPAKVAFPMDDATKAQVNVAMDYFRRSAKEKKAARRSAHAKGSDKHAKDADGKMTGYKQRKADEKAASDPLFNAVKEAVKNNGMTVSEVLVGMTVARFNALDEKTKAGVLEKAEKRARRNGSTSKKSTRMADRVAKKIEKEKARMASLKSDKDKDAFIRSAYRRSHIVRDGLLA